MADGEVSAIKASKMAQANMTNVRASGSRESMLISKTTENISKSRENRVAFK